MKIIAVAFLALMIMSVSALAEDAVPTLISADEPVDEETAKQAKVMVTPKGAEVRLTQLEKSVEKNIVFGEKIIERINANFSDHDTSMLESLLEELEVLKDEIIAVDPSQSDDAVQQFVDLKKDAKDISKEFRDLVHEVLNGTEAEGLKSQIGREVAAQMNQWKEQIREKIRNHNEEVVQRKLQNMKKTNSELVQNVKSGAANLQEVKNQLKQELQRMTEEEKKEAVMELKRSMTSLSVKAQSAIQAAEEGFQERLQERLHERLQTMSQEDSTALQERLNAVNEAAGSSETSGSAGENGSGSGMSVTGQAVRGGNGR